jgi:hypothetical protein
MSMENFNKAPKTENRPGNAERPAVDNIKSPTESNPPDKKIHEAIERGKEKGTAPSSQSKTDNDSKPKEDKYNSISDKDRRDQLGKLEGLNPSNEKGKQMVSDRKQKLLYDNLKDLKNQQEPSQAQAEKNNLKGDYGQKKSDSDTQNPKLQEQPQVNNELPRITIPQEKYNQRQELLDRISPHRTQKSESSPPKETPSNRF